MNKTNTFLNAVIIGAGPAGLTAADELLRKTAIHPVIFEMSNDMGGISRTIQYKDNLMDIGSHRFFSKNQEVMNWWTRMMPLQGEPALDDILFERKDIPFIPGGPDPEKEDRVILYRQRISRIFFLRKFFDYPISLKLETFTNMGLCRTIQSGFSYVVSQIHKRPNDTLEDFYINHFGKTLYQLFFEDYTEKVWGVHPSKLGADWGSQRIKGVSVWAVIKDMFVKKIGVRRTDEKEETSLIEQFLYPKLGAGQIWQIAANEICANGGEIYTQSQIKKIHIQENRVVSVDYEKEGKLVNYPCDYLLSSMPIKDLVAAIADVDVPPEVRRIASELPYRDFISVGLLVKKMKIPNKTKIKTFNDRLPDSWIYIQERDVKIGRLQIFNNWSPYMLKDYENTMWLGLEYFCSEGDDMWTMDKDTFLKMAIDELVKINLIDKEDVLDAVQIKVEKAYPSYYGAYYELDKVKSYLDTIENLYCIGRNGQHRYNNMDHSMLTAMEAVKNIKDNLLTKSNIWAVNTEDEYHEKHKNN